MKTEKDLDPSEATAAHTVIPAGFIRRKWLQLPAEDLLHHVHTVYIILRVGNCLYCADLLVGPDEDVVDCTASPPASFAHVMSFLLGYC